MAGVSMIKMQYQRAMKKKKMFKMLFLNNY